MLTISQATFRYPRGDFHLEVPQMDVGAGQCIALTGPSGSGKTTLLHLAAGILTPTMGRIVVDEFDLAAQSESVRRRFRLTRLGLVFQSFELLAHLNARDNIELPCRLAGVTPQQDDLAALGQALGIESLLNRFPSELSHGECQRVAIARALLHAPSVVLADEPTGNLDPDKKLTVVRLLLDACRERNASVLMATHDLDLLDLFDDSIHVPDLVASTSGASS